MVNLIAGKFGFLDYLDRIELLKNLTKLSFRNDALVEKLHGLFDFSLRRQIMTYFNEIEEPLTDAQLEKLGDEASEDSLVALYLAGKEEALKQGLASFSKNKVIPERVHLLARLAGQPQGEYLVDIPEEEAMGAELVKKAGLPFSQAGQDQIHRLVFLSEDKSAALVVLGHVLFSEGKVCGVTSRLWREMVAKTLGAQKVAVVSRSLFNKKGLLKHVLDSQGLESYSGCLGEGKEDSDS